MSFIWIVVGCHDQQNASQFTVCVTTIGEKCCYRETQWSGMYRQSETRAGNHRMHTRTRNASSPTQANNTARGAWKQAPNQDTLHAASEDTTHKSHRVPRGCANLLAGAAGRQVSPGAPYEDRRRVVVGHIVARVGCSRVVVGLSYVCANGGFQLA